MHITVLPVWHYRKAVHICLLMTASSTERSRCVPRIYHIYKMDDPRGLDGKGSSREVVNLNALWSWISALHATYAIRRTVDAPIMIPKRPYLVARGVTEHLRWVPGSVSCHDGSTVLKSCPPTTSCLKDARPCKSCRGQVKIREISCAEDPVTRLGFHRQSRLHSRK